MFTSRTESGRKLAKSEGDEGVGTRHPSFTYKVTLKFSEDSSITKEVFGGVLTQYNTAPRQASPLATPEQWSRGPPRAAHSERLKMCNATSRSSAGTVKKYCVTVCCVPR